MSNQLRNSPINVRVGGDVSGQLAIGNNISQGQSTRSPTEVTDADRQVFVDLLSELKKHIEAQAPAENKSAALERVQELGDAIQAEQPDLTTLQYVTEWFRRKLPSLAGSVTSLLIHPIVGKLVEAGGELAAEQLKRLVHASPTKP